MSLERLKRELRKKETRVPLELIERNELVSNYAKSKRITFAALKKDMHERGKFFPQPIRTQPSLDTFKEHPEWTISTKIAKQTAKDVKEWGPKIFADIKYDGVRGLLYVNPKTDEVKIYSRRMKELHKLEKKYADAILENVGKGVKSESVFDGEIYAVDYDGKLLDYGTVAGWSRNPYDEKYKDLIPTIEVFDVVMLNNKDMRKLPLKFRKKLLETSLKNKDGRVLDIADTRYMKNHPRPIEWRFKAIIRGKGEGLVVKDPDSEYFYGKPKGKANPWRKLKAADTIDLEMKAIESSPKEQEFEDYRHWIFVPSDDEEHEVKANKGIRAANYDNNFYRAFSLDMINKWKLGKLIGSDDLIPVRKDLIEYYGVDAVPNRLTFPPDRRYITEIFVEKISKNLYPSGTKVVGIRDDKDIGDTMDDLKNLSDFFLFVKEK